MTLTDLIKLPADLVCDRLEITDEHERGMMRMLVNMCIISAVSAVVFFVFWKTLI